MEGNGKKFTENQKSSKQNGERRESKSIDKSNELRVDKVEKPIKWTKNKHSFVVAGKDKLNLMKCFL